MKFNDLYNRVFIKEQDDTEIADPAKFDDVAPAPVPEPVSAEVEASAPAVPPADLSSFMQELLTFGNKLMDEKNPGQSMLAVLRKLDKPETPFEGIYGRTNNEILQAKDLLNSIASELLKFSIQAAKS